MDYYDPTWTPQEADQLTQAAQRLETFDPNAGIEPRKAFLLAKWMRSYAQSITDLARAQRETPDVDENALDLAQHIIGENK